MRTLLIVTYLFAQFLPAQNPAFNPDESKGQLYEYAEFTKVSKSNLEINEILTSDLKYMPLESENHTLGFTSDNYWVRFKLHNSSPQLKTYYLETARPITDVAHLYEIANDTIKTFKSGDQIPFKERQVKHRQTVFRINLPADSVQEYYLFVTSDGETINLPLDLYTEEEYLRTNYSQQLFLGLFYGILCLAGLIYLFFYTSLREKTFLYYGLYVFSIGFLQAALDGLIYEYLLPDGGFLNSRMVLITALFSNFFLLKYCEYFLKIDSNLKSLKKGYNIAYGIIFTLFTMVFISPSALEMVYPISNLNGLYSLLLILASLFTLRYKKMPVDKYFSIGIFFLVIGLLGFVMNNLSLLPNNFYTLNSAKFGSGFEVIFLSLSMTNLIRKLRLEHEESQELALQKSEEISELKTFFMSNISHELRTPINAIMGVVETELASKDNNTEQRKTYEIIKNASISLLSNVNDVLDFERIEKDELKLRHERFNPSILLNQISNNWKSEAEKKGLKYVFEMDHEIPVEVEGDAARFIQIINNVLSNAIKYTNQGQIKFKLKCLVKPNEVCKFSFQVSDTGVGMDENNKRQVFDSFNQMRLDNRRQFGGIGLGLTIVKHLVKLFDGDITIESELNKGTDVFIEIPLKFTKKADEPIETSPKSEQAYHILIVEDNKMNQLVMRKLLNSFPNVTFAVANNGQEALDTLNKGVYDIILMDLQMPVMDGYEATEKIRSGYIGDNKNDIPIIAVTADAMEATRQRVLDIGMNDYMTKPVNRDLLFQKIENCYKEAVLKIA
ncbi:7TM diverse intracellular signaling domain-containing protein [Winogradskyella sp. A3E31]|uniref:hybrid sensor histidine kinase/response regulator n=1 Tax=Winogradskyella sp. A3E31 TaxID=3349637 RepID=UPI00398AD918